MTAHVILKVNLYLKMFMSTVLMLLWPSLKLVFHYQRLILFVSEIIPFVWHQERDKVKEELRGRNLSVVFDGTTHVEEALAIVVRFVDDFTIKQRLLCLKLLKKSTTGEELARVLISTLST